MIFSPTITVETQPGLQIDVNTPGLTYAAVLQAIGSVSLRLDVLYYGANTYQQYKNPPQYVGYDINSNLKKFSVSTPINPNQFYPSMYMQLESRDMEFDGQSMLNINILGNEVIYFIFYGDRTEFRNFLDAIGIKNNFQALQQNMNTPDFFKEYTDVLV